MITDPIQQRKSDKWIVDEPRRNLVVLTARREQMNNPLMQIKLRRFDHEMLESQWERDPMNSPEDQRNEGLIQQNVRCFDHMSVEKIVGKGSDWARGNFRFFKVILSAVSIYFSVDFSANYQWITGMNERERENFVFQQNCYFINFQKKKVSSSDLR